MANNLGEDVSYGLTCDQYLMVPTSQLLYHETLKVCFIKFSVLKSDGKSLEGFSGKLLPHRRDECAVQPT